MDQTNPPSALPLDLPTYSSSNYTALVQSSRLKPSDGVRRTRFLLGRFIYDVPSKEDVLQLFNLVFLLGNCSESSFVRKHGFLLSLLLKMDFTAVDTVTNGVKELKNIFPRMFPHSREYFSQRNQVQSEPHLVLVFRQPKRLKSKRHVGVGYNDKGTLRDSSTDGSPSWEEVAMDEWFQTNVSVPSLHRSPFDGLRDAGLYDHSRFLAR